MRGGVEAWLAGGMALLLVWGLFTGGPGGGSSGGVRHVGDPLPIRDEPYRLVFLGDSLTAGYGVPPPARFPARVAAGLRAAGVRVEAINAGVSGDTTREGLDRLGPDVLAHDPDLVLVCLGGNDAMARRPPRVMRADLREILVRCQQAGARVALAGIHLPALLPPGYRSEFEAAYPELAAELGLSYLPSLLAGIEGRREYYQTDRIHPTAEGQAVVAETVLDFLVPVFERPPAGGVAVRVGGPGRPGAG